MSKTALIQCKELLQRQLVIAKIQAKEIKEVTEQLQELLDLVNTPLGEIDE